MSSNSSKKVGGRPISKIWEWIIKEDPIQRLILFVNFIGKVIQKHADPLHGLVLV